MKKIKLTIVFFISSAFFATAQNIEQTVQYLNNTLQNYGYNLTPDFKSYDSLAVDKTGMIKITRFVINSSTVKGIDKNAGTGQFPDFKFEKIIEKKEIKVTSVYLKDLDLIEVSTSPLIAIRILAKENLDRNTIKVLDPATREVEFSNYIYINFDNSSPIDKIQKAFNHLIKISKENTAFLSSDMF